jgi:hypothetical protein
MNDSAPLASPAPPPPISIGYVMPDDKGVVPSFQVPAPPPPPISLAPPAPPPITTYSAVLEPKVAGATNDPDDLNT